MRHRCIPWSKSRIPPIDKYALSNSQSRSDSKTEAFFKYLYEGLPAAGIDIEWFNLDACLHEQLPKIGYIADT